MPCSDSSSEGTHDSSLRGQVGKLAENLATTATQEPGMDERKANIQ